MITATFVACKQAETVESTETTDSTAVVVDSVVIDSVAVDTVIGPVRPESEGAVVAPTM